MQNGKSSRPDNFFTDAGEEMEKTIHYLVPMSWETSKVPDKWKEPDVKFLRKSGKKSYHDASAYRRISLCKCLERLITHRLYGFVEHFGLLDDEQERFRRFRVQRMHFCDSLRMFSMVSTKKNKPLHFSLIERRFDVEVNEIRLNRKSVEMDQ